MPQKPGRSALVVPFWKIERDVLEFRAADLKRREHGVKRGGRLQPIGFGFELRGVANGLARRYVRDGLEHPRAFFAANAGDDLKRGCFDANELIHFAVE